jgi:hypothetical protein
MKKIVKLTESDLARIVKRVIRENEDMDNDPLKGHIEVYHEYKNGKIDKDLFYRFLGVLDRRDKERLMDYIKSQKETKTDLVNEEQTSNDTASFRLFNCLTKSFTNKFVKDEDSALSEGRTTYTRSVKLGGDAKGTQYTQTINAYKKGNQTFISMSTSVKDVPLSSGIKKPQFFNMNQVGWSANEKPLMDCNQLKSLILKNSPVNLVPQKYFM